MKRQKLLRGAAAVAVLAAGAALAAAVGVLDESEDGGGGVVAAGDRDALADERRDAAPAADETAVGAASAPAVRTMTVASPTSTAERQFFGRVRARETVDMAFEVGGALERLIPEEGMRVPRGAIIAQLRLDPFERAVARATLDRDLAAREVARARRLAETAAGPASRAEDAEIALDLAEVALRDARAALDDATLTAPFDALVAVRIAAQHASVSPGEPVLRLHDMSETRVSVAIPERLLAAAGGLDALRFAARLPTGDATPLRLVAYQSEADGVDQSFRVTLAFDEDAPPGLMPGASVTVRVSTPVNGPPGASVPAEALVAGNDRSAAVFVLEADGDALVTRRRSVQVGSATGAGFLVEGLSPGEEIVAAGAHRLRDGQRVRRFAALAPAGS